MPRPSIIDRKPAAAPALGQGAIDDHSTEIGQGQKGSGRLAGRGGRGG
jgi:hypothetical protein